MANFREAFTNRHAVLPVIHVVDQVQVLKNTEIARGEGADGVFLISMRGMLHTDLLRMHQSTRERFPDWFIGVNCLDLPAVSVFRRLNKGVSGVWVDDGGIDENAEKQIEADLIQRNRDESKWDGLYFGGTAFKYQKPVHDLSRVARVASGFMDVVTTSGDQTGRPPSPEKISIMKKAIGERPLAIASGISPRNVEYYKEADAFLVATSLLIHGTEDFDRAKVKDLVDAVRGN